MLSDENLIERIRAGDTTAVAELAERYRTALHRFVENLLNDPACAEDLVQDVFTKLAAHSDLPHGSVRPWLYKVARNRAYDLLRRANRSPTAHRLPTGIDAAQTATGVATRAAKQERDSLIRDIVSAMPDEYRDVVTLKYFENLSRDEIALVLDLTDAAVKGRLARGLEHLRTELRRLTGSSL